MRKCFTVPTHDDFICVAMKTMEKSECVGFTYWPHNLMGAVMDIMPDYIVTSVIMSIHMATCKRGMKKYYAKKAE